MAKAAQNMFAENPFMKTPFNFDMTKMFGGFDTKAFDVNAITGEFTKAMSEMKFANVDLAPVLDSQRRNIEAFAAANKLALEGVQAVMKRQGEIMQKAVDEVSTVLTTVPATKNPQETVAGQTELLKDAVEAALVNMRELAEMVSKSNTEAFETVNVRFNESLDEIKTEVLKLKA